VKRNKTAKKCREIKTKREELLSGDTVTERRKRDR